VNLIGVEISKKKKKYRWKRPEACPTCIADKVWGHGFVIV